MINSDKFPILGKFNALIDRRSDNLHEKELPNTKINLKLIRSRNNHKHSIHHFTQKCDKN